MVHQYANTGVIYHLTGNTSMMYHRGMVVGTRFVKEVYMNYSIKLDPMLPHSLTASLCRRLVSGSAWDDKVWWFALQDALNCCYYNESSEILQKYISTFPNPYWANLIYIHVW